MRIPHIAASSLLGLNHAKSVVALWHGRLRPHLVKHLPELLVLVLVFVILLEDVSCQLSLVHHDRRGGLNFVTDTVHTDIVHKGVKLN